MWLDSKAVNCPQKWGDFNLLFELRVASTEMRVKMGTANAFLTSSSSSTMFVLMNASRDHCRIGAFVLRMRRRLTSQVKHFRRLASVAE